MKRIKIEPRDNYVKTIEGLGFHFHENYWLENAYYEFTEDEIEKIYLASVAIHDMFTKATDHVISNNLWDKFHIPREMVPAIIKSWEDDEPSLYGRFDFAMVNGIPMLLEYNADTPTSLLEASVIQWNWRESLFPNRDQFNSIHENLIESFDDIRPPDNKIGFCCISDNTEDFGNTSYIASCAGEAGISTSVFDISELRYDGESHNLPSEEKISTLFKLYPWEWLMREEGKDTLINTTTKFIEPLWKSLWSNKYMLVLLYELFPDNPFILKASEKPLSSGNYCKKPIFSREGANVTLIKNDEVIEKTSGEYGEEGFIYQELVDLECYDGMYPIVGSWVIGGEPSGVGIRENPSKITNNMSNFVPHVF